MKRFLNPIIINSGRSETTAAYMKHALLNLPERNAWHKAQTTGYKDSAFYSAEKKAQLSTETEDVFKKYTPPHAPVNTRLFPYNLIDTRAFEKDYNQKSEPEKTKGLMMLHTIKAGYAQKPGPNPHSPFKLFKKELPSGSLVNENQVRVSLIKKRVPDPKNVPLFGVPLATPEELNRTFGPTHGFKPGDFVYLINHIE